MINFEEERRKLAETIEKNSYRNNFGIPIAKKPKKIQLPIGHPQLGAKNDKPVSLVKKSNNPEYLRRERDGVVTPPRTDLAKDKRLDTRMKLAEAKEPEYVSTGRLLKAQAFKGLTGFNAGLAKTVDFFLPDILTPKIVQKGINYYKDIDNKQQEYINRMRKTKGQEIAGGLTASLVQAIPNMVLAVMTGGASVAEQGAGALAAFGARNAAGAVTAGRLAISNGEVASAAKFLQNAVSANAKNPMFWNSFAQTLGPTYEKEKANGAGNAQAMMSALLNATVGASIEIGGGIETIKSVDFRSMPLKDVIKTIGKNTLKTAGEEGLEEIEQYSVEQLASMASGTLKANDPDNWFSLDKNKDAVINPLAQAEQFGYGAAIGGIMGGTNNVVNAGLQKTFSHEAEYSGRDKDGKYIVKELNTSIGRADKAKPGEQLYSGADNVIIVKSASKQGFEVTIDGQTHDVDAEKVKNYLIKMRSKAPIAARQAQIATSAGLNATTKTLKKTISPETESKLIETISKRAGLNVVFDDLGEGFEGKISGNTVTISRQANNPVYQVLKHELTHHIENSEHYDSYKNFVISGLQNSGHDVDTEISSIVRSYAENGITLSDEEAKNEYVANFSEEYLFNSEESIRRLARENPNLFIKVYDWIKDTITKIGETKETKFLIDAQRKYEKALRTMSKEEQAAFRNEAVLSDDKEKLSIKSTFEDDIDKVIKGTFDSAKGEVEVGTTSDFMTKIIGAEPLKVTMPARKIYGAIMKAEDVPQNRYDRTLNYHGLGKETFYKAIKASEQPIAAYVCKNDPETGEQRNDTIALVTDVKDDKGNYIVIFNKVGVKSRVSNKKYDVNKIVSSYGREYLQGQIQDSIADGRILYLGKKRNHAIGGAGSLSSNGRLPDFDTNISNFWANVNYLHGKTKTETERTPNNRIGEALKKAQIKKEQKSSGQSYINDPKLKGASENLYGEDGNKYLSNPKYGYKKASVTPKSKQPAAITAQASVTGGKPNASPKSSKPKSDKASKYEKKSIAEFNGEMKNLLGAVEYDDIKSIRAERREIIEKIKSGTLTDEDKRKYFNRMFDSVLEIDKNFVNTYAEIRKELKKPKFLVSEKTLNNITDFKLRKKEFRHINFAKPGESGIDIDPFYESMREKYPTVFQEVNTQEEMLEQLAEKSNIYESAKSRLSAAADSDEIYEASWKKFNEEIDVLIEQERLAKRYRDSKVKPEIKSISAESANEHIHKINAIKKDIREANDKLLLSEEDVLTVNELLERRISIDTVKRNYDNADNIITMYEAKKALREAQEPIRKMGSETRAAIDKKFEELLSTAEYWKDKKDGFWFERETAERNMEDIMNKEEAAAINAYVFTPVHQNEAIKNREKNRYAQITKELNISTKNEFTVKKILPGKNGTTVYDWVDAPGLPYQLIANKGKISESALVQLKGEGKIDDDFIRNVGANVEKINKAVDAIRGIYKELFERVNAVLIKFGYDPIEWRENYFPHFSERKSDRLLGRIMRKLGYNFHKNDLPTDIAGLTENFKPGKKWVGNFLERTGNATEYDALKGLEMYLENALDVIHHTEDIQRVRRFELAVRAKFGEKGYKLELAKLRRRWESGDITDETYEEEINKLQKAGPTKQNALAIWLREYGNLLAGKKSRHDRSPETSFGRGIYDLGRNLESAIASNMTGMNISSATTNFIPLIQAGYVSPVQMLKAAAETLVSRVRNDGFTDESDFLTNRIGSEKIYRDNSQKLRDFTSKPMEVIDSFTSQVIVRAKYNEMIKKGLTSEEAMMRADRFAADVIADRSKGAMPTLFAAKNPLLKAVTMFQLEVNNQWSHLFKDIPRNTNNIAAATAAYLNVAIGSYLFNDLSEKLIGRRPALDIFSWINDIVGDTTGTKANNFVEVLLESIPDDDDEDFWENVKENLTKETKKGIAAQGLVENIAEDTPFVGSFIGGGRLPINAAKPDFNKLWQGWGMLSEDEATRKKAGQKFRKEITKPLTYLILPTGGSQLRKTVEGIEAVVKKGSYGIDQKGNDVLQYSVDDDYKSVLKAALFGKSSTKKAQEWIENDFDSMNNTQTKAYIAMLEEHIKPSEAEELAKNITSTEVDSKMRRQIGALSLENYKKNAILNKLDPYNHADYSRPETLEFADLGKDSREIVLDIEKATGKNLKQALEIYNIKKAAGTAKRKQALMLMEAGYGKKTLKKLGYKDSEDGALTLALAAKKAGITAEELSLMFEIADVNKENGITQKEVIEYLTKRNDLTREQKYYAMIAMCAPAERNNPWR